MIQSLPIRTQQDRTGPWSGSVSLYKNYHWFSSLWAQLFERICRFVLITNYFLQFGISMFPIRKKIFSPISILLFSCEHLNLLFMYKVYVLLYTCIGFIQFGPVWYGLLQFKFGSSQSRSRSDLNILVWSRFV